MPSRGCGRTSGAPAGAAPRAARHCCRLASRACRLLPTPAHAALSLPPPAAFAWHPSTSRATTCRGRSV
eukprot:scaffold15035_cov119-Isochrysis_galbana.AAC.2